MMLRNQLRLSSIDKQYLQGALLLPLVIMCLSYTPIVALLSNKILFKEWGGCFPAAWTVL
jgi:hypothetical protein